MNIYPIGVAEEQSSPSSPANPSVHWAFASSARIGAIAFFGGSSERRKSHTSWFQSDFYLEWFLSWVEFSEPTPTYHPYHPCHPYHPYHPYHLDSFMCVWLIDGLYPRSCNQVKNPTGFHDSISPWQRSLNQTDFPRFPPQKNMEPFGFVWKCWVNIPNEIAIFHRDNDQQNHWENGVHNIFSNTPIFLGGWHLFFCGPTRFLSKNPEVKLQLALACWASWPGVESDQSLMRKWMRIDGKMMVNWWEYDENMMANWWKFDRNMLPKVCVVRICEN